ncbi:hypothetical protein BGZ70_004202, partial [Mortierella alpina]
GKDNDNPQVIPKTDDTQTQHKPATSDVSILLPEEEAMLDAKITSMDSFHSLVPCSTSSSFRVPNLGEVLTCSHSGTTRTKYSTMLSLGVDSLTQTLPTRDACLFASQRKLDTYRLRSAMKA